MNHVGALKASSGLFFARWGVRTETFDYGIFCARLHRALIVAGLATFACLGPAPAWATTAIDVTAGATGSFAGIYSLGVSYFTPNGLTVRDSGSLNGTTASYSPTAAPIGLNAIMLTAAVNGLTSGSSMASADLRTGTVRATAASDGYLASGTAHADLYEDVTFAVAGGGSQQITVISHLDGMIGSFANTFSVSALGYTLNFGGSNFLYTSLGSQGGFTVSAGGAYGGPPDGWDSYALSNVTDTGFDFTGLLTITDGEKRSIGQRLYLNCQEGVNCDFSHTGSIALQLPAGVTFTSGSGVFLAPPAPGAVPEPASWAMLLAGFGLIGAATRGQRIVMRRSNPQQTAQTVNEMSKACCAQ